MLKTNKKAFIALKKTHLPIKDFNLQTTIYQQQAGLGFGIQFWSAKLSFKHFVVCFCMFLICGTMYGQADNCASAGVITCGTTLTGQTNVGATSDAFPSCNTSGILATGAPNVWYTFVGNGNVVTVNTCTSTNFDSEIGIFSGSCGSLVCVAGSDSDGCGTADETVTFTSLTGTNYFIMIQGHASATGTFTINVSCSAGPCASPIETIACGVTKTLTLTGSGAGWSPGSCGFSTPGAEKVYSFTPTVTGNYTLEVTTGDGTFIDYFFKTASSGCGPTGWTCIDDNSSAGTDIFGPLTAGTEYLILLDDENTIASTHSFRINCLVDPCASPIETMTCGVPKTVALTGSGAGWNVTACGFSTPGAEKVYSFTPAVTGNYTLQVTAADGSFVDYFFKAASGGCGSTGWTCIDDNSGAGTDIFGTLTAGTTYFILLDDENTSTSIHTFLIQCLCAPFTPVINVAETSLTPNDGTICDASTTLLTASGAVSYLWSTAATTASITVNPSTTTTYTVTATDANGCTGTNTRTITVVPLPSITSVITQPTTCVSLNGSIDISVGTAPGGFNYLWSTAATTEDVSGLIVGTYTVTVTSSNGCSNTSAFSLAGPGGCGICPTVSSLSITPTTSNCVGSSKTFTASGLSNMSPTFGIQFVSFTAATSTPYSGGTVLATVPNASLTSGGTIATASASFASANTYFVYAILSPTPTDPLCRPFASSTIVINSLPPAMNTVTETSGTTMNDGIICQGATATITASGGTTYLWSTAANTASITVNTAGTYTATVTSAAGCTATTTRVITVNPSPTVFNVTGTATICVVATGVPVGLSGSQLGVTYQLQRNGTNVTTLAGNGSALTFPNQTMAGTYTIIATNNTTACSVQMSGSAVLTLDTQAPTIVCPTSISQNVAPTTCSAVVTYIAPVGTDNCPNPMTTRTAGLASGSTYPVGITNHVFRVTDINGLTATCAFNVTVVDNILPVITCPANISTNVEVATCNKVITYMPPVGTDNCASPITTQTSGIASGQSVGPGVYTNVFRVTDASNNTATCSFTVTVVGGPPVITCPPLIAVNNSPGLCGAFVNYTATVAPVFPPATITYSIQSGSFFEQGLTTVTATASNSCGSSSCTFNVIVSIGPDPELPAAYTILANNYVGLKGSIVKSGGVGTYAPNGVVEAQAGATVSGGNTFVKTAVLYLSGGSVVDNPIAGNVNPSIVPSYAFTGSNNSLNNITVPDNTTRVLNQDIYGDVKVGNNSTIIFTGNTEVRIKSLRTARGSRINFSQNTALKIKGVLELGESNAVNIGSSNFVIIYVDANATVKEGCRVNANIHTLRLLIASGGALQTQMTGLFIGHQVNSEANVVWNRNTLNCQLIGVGLKTSNGHDKEIDGTFTDSRSKGDVSFKLYPNPASDLVQIEYQLPSHASVYTFEIFDMDGRILATKTLDNHLQGKQVLSWDTQGLKTGVYLVAMKAGKEILYRNKLFITH